MPHPLPWWRAATLYFALVFALGFALGVLRTLLLRGGGDRLLAVLIELPLMLTASWWICAWVLRRCAVPARAAARLQMGGAALALLLLAELLFGALAFGRSPAAQLGLYREPSYALGLAAQLGFGLMPWLQLRRGG